MSILLYLPGLLFILFKRQGLLSTFRLMTTIIAVQTLIALPFLQEDPWAYLNSAFDFGRVFLYKWTVNWRFLDEEVFLSRQWALGLLIVHLTVLVLFGWFKWCRPDGGVWNMLHRGLTNPSLPAGRVPLTADGMFTFYYSHLFH